MALKGQIPRMIQMERPFTTMVAILSMQMIFSPMKPQTKLGLKPSMPIHLSAAKSPHLNRWLWRKRITRPCRILTRAHRAEHGGWNMMTSNPYVVFLVPPRTPRPAPASWKFSAPRQTEALLVILQRSSGVLSASTWSIWLRQGLPEKVTPCRVSHGRDQAVIESHIRRFSVMIPVFARSQGPAKYEGPQCQGGRDWCPLGGDRLS
jgi:hypothetical protein